MTTDPSTMAAEQPRPRFLPVVGANVVIDALVERDAEALSVSHSDPDNARYQGWRSPLSIEEARRFIAENADVALLEPGSGAQCALRTMLGGPLVGDVYLERSDATPWQVELGITLAPGAHGRGLATGAICALVDAIRTASLPGGRVHRFVAVADIDNVASRRLFERVGFRPEGHLVASGRRRDGTFADEIVYGLVLADHPSGDDDEPVVTTTVHPGDAQVLPERIYEFNVEATGFADGQELFALIRDRHGRIVAGIQGHVWGGAAEVKELWLQADRRGLGTGSRLLRLFEDEARRRGARRIFVSSHSFQAPAFYERHGYTRTGTWDDFPVGHSQVFLAKDLAEENGLLS